MHILKFLGLALFLVGCGSTNKNVNSELVEVPSSAVDSPFGDSFSNNEVDNLEIDSFLITENSVGVFNKGMTIDELIQMVPKRQIKKKKGYGEFKDDSYDEYQIYDGENNPILTLTPPDLEHIVLSVGQIGAWFSINKSELEEGWWDEEEKKIDKTKIPAGSRFDSFIIWWN